MVWLAGVPARQHSANRSMRQEINRLRSVNYVLRDDIDALKDHVDSYPELKEKFEDPGIMF